MLPPFQPLSREPAPATSFISCFFLWFSPVRRTSSSIHSWNYIYRNSTKPSLHPGLWKLTCQPVTCPEPGAMWRCGLWTTNTIRELAMQPLPSSVPEYNNNSPVKQLLVKLYCRAFSFKADVMPAISPFYQDVLPFPQHALNWHPDKWCFDHCIWT